MLLTDRLIGALRRGLERAQHRWFGALTRGSQWLRDRTTPGLPWSGIILMTAAWTLARPWIARPTPEVAAPLLAIAAALVLMQRTRSAPRLPAWLGVGAAACAALVWASPLPWTARWAIALPLAAAAGLPLVSRTHRPDLAWGLIEIAAIGVVMTAMDGLFALLGPRVHDLGVAGWSAELIELLGVDVTAVGGRLSVANRPEQLTFAPTGEALGLFPLLLFAAGMTVCGVLRSHHRRGRALLAAAAALVALAPVRHALVVLFAAESSSPALLWKPWAMLVSLTPMFIAAALAYRLFSDRETHLAPVRFRRVVGVFAAAALAVTCFVVAARWVPAGSLKTGRVLIDDSHGAWESSTARFDHGPLANGATYQYAELRRLLEQHYDTGVFASGELDDEALAPVDVLILKTPSRPFSGREIAAIESFVDRGGGLLMLGDHTNLFGMSTHLNAVAESFGIHFSSDDTFDLATGRTSRWRPPHLLAHPSVSAVREHEFATSCSLAASLDNQDVIVGYQLGAERGDYSRPGYFGNMRYDLDDRFGVFLQAVAGQHGQGRVAAHCDSTVLSNFSLMTPGTREYLLGTVDFLNRRSNDRWRRYLWLAGVLLACLACGPLLVATGRERATGVALGSIVAIVLAATAVDRYHRSAYGPPAPRVESGTAYLLFDDAQMRLPGLLESELPHRDRARDFDTFYVWFQRLGLFPRVATDLESIADGRSLIIIVEPRKVFTRADQAALHRHLRAGGRALILDSTRNRDSTANTILRHFGLKVTDADVRPELLWARASRDPIEAAPRSYLPRLSVEGGVPVLLDRQSPEIVMYAKSPVGRGVIAAAVDAASFSSARLGSRFHPANRPEEVEAFQLQRAILTDLLSEEP
jgi:hypothetical protein